MKAFFGVFFCLNISAEHKEYCDNFYITVHNVKNLQIIKYTIVYTHLWRAKGAENLAMAREARIEAEAQIPMSVYWVLLFFCGNILYSPVLKYITRNR